MSILCAILHCFRYAKQRKAFDKPIATMYAIQEKISTMSYKIDAARLLIYKAAMLKDAHKPYTKDAAQAKLFASEAATWCSHQAIQVQFWLLYLFNVVTVYIFLIALSKAQSLF